MGSCLSHRETRQSFDPAQDLSGNLGKVVRINPDGSIPDDNPFQNKSGARADIWTAGHRNPLGAAINPSSGQLWIHEMRPKGGDEINVIEGGKNYGWPIASKGDHYDDTAISRHSTNTDFAPPAKSWNPSISPSGIIFYDGPIAGWRGNALLGGLSSKALIRLALDGDRVIGEERIDMNRRIRDIIQSPDGTILLLSDGIGGELLRLTPTNTTSSP
jgi:aldose sugar dehydrogenase